jgi:hypothetical protein
VDDPTVKDVFASELVSVTATGDTITMTLCASRTTMDWPELKVQRVVTARLVIPANTALNLCARIQQVLHQKQLLETVKGRKLS